MEILYMVSFLVSCYSTTYVFSWKYEKMKILPRVHSFLAYSPSRKGAYEIIMLYAHAFGCVCMCTSMWLFVSLKVCLSVCMCSNHIPSSSVYVFACLLPPFQVLNNLTDLHNIQCRLNDIWGHLIVIPLNFLQSVITAWQMDKLGRLECRLI